MSQLLDIGLLEEESDSGETQDAHRSPSRCSSSSSMVTYATKFEKRLEVSTSLETAWTDSKHSSFLDSMEANFVQNMFARFYCMDDVCGGASQHHRHHHHHHHHCQQQMQQHNGCRSDFEENDHSTAESRLHSQETVEHSRFNFGGWTSRAALRVNEPAVIPRGLLANQWVKHFRPSNVSSKPSTLLARNDEVAKRVADCPETSFLSTNNKDEVAQRDADCPETSSPLTNIVEHHDDEAVKGDAESLETSSPFINNVEHHDWTSNSISGSDKPASPKKFVNVKSGEVKDMLLNNSCHDRIGRSKRKKRRVLWSTYKQAHRTRQQSGNRVEGGNMLINDGAVALLINP